MKLFTLKDLSKEYILEIIYKSVIRKYYIIDEDNNEFDNNNNNINSILEITPDDKESSLISTALNLSIKSIIKNKMQIKPQKIHICHNKLLDNVLQRDNAMLISDHYNMIYVNNPKFYNKKEFHYYNNSVLSFANKKSKLLQSLLYLTSLFDKLYHKNR